MRAPTAILSTSLTSLLALASTPAFSQKDATLSTFNLPVSVFEVVLPFTAADYQGRPFEDLTQADLRITDNGKQQHKILTFRHETSLPIHAGILVDTSRSMFGEPLRYGRYIVKAFSEHILRSATDRAFVTEFDFSPTPLTPWTSDATQLQYGASQLAANAYSRMGGTALYDSIYRITRDQFATQTSPPGSAVNVILLFSDGNDTVSHAYLQDVVDICQQTRTSIYVFSGQPKTHFDDGEKNLRALAEKTGGRIFFDEDTKLALQHLHTLEGDLRDRYVLSYRPEHLKSDGKFHSLRLTSPTRGGDFLTRSGYYAPMPPK